MSDANDDDEVESLPDPSDLFGGPPELNGEGGAGVAV